MAMTIKTAAGYACKEKKEGLVQKLGKLEHELIPAMAEFCRMYCRFFKGVKHSDVLEKKCQKCPLNDLLNEVEGE